MDFRKLQAFAKVYETRGFSKAGEELYLSQPTVSTHVASLEEELGVRLFDRMGKVVLPTPAGELLYAGVHEIFDRLERTVAEVRLMQDRVVGNLAIGGSTIPAHYILPGRMAAFVRENPEVQLNLVGGDTEEICSQVAEGRLSIGVVGADPARPDLRAEPIADDQVVAVAPADMACEGLAWDELASLPWIMRESGSGTRRTFEKALAAAGRRSVDLNVAAMVESTEAVLQCVREGMGLGLVSRLAAESASAGGAIVILSGLGMDMRRHFYAVFQANRSLTPAAAAFLGILGVRLTPEAPL